MTPRELKELMEQMGLSQGDLAKLLEVDRRTVNRWVNGNYRINARTAKLIRQLAENAGVAA